MKENRKKKSKKTQKSRCVENGPQPTNSDDSIFLIGGENRSLFEYVNASISPTLSKKIPKAHGSRVWDICCTTDEKFISCSHDGNIKKWEIPTHVNHTLSGHTGPVFGLSWHKFGDLSLLASCSKDTSVRIWNLENCESIWTIDDHKLCVRDTVFTPPNQTVASASWDGNIGIFDLTKQEKINFLKKHKEWARLLFFEETKQILLSGGNDSKMFVWDLNTNKNVAEFAGGERSDVIYSICRYSEDAENLVITGDESGTVKIWDLRKLDSVECVKSFQAHSDVIWRIKRICGEDKYVTCSSDMTVKTWEVGSEKLKNVILNDFGVHCLEYIEGKNTKKVVRALESKNAKTKKENEEFVEVSTKITGQNDGEEQIEIDDEEKKDFDELLIFGGEKKQMYFVKPSAKQLIATVKKAHKHRIWDIMNVGNNHFCSCSQDSTIKLWDLKTQELYFQFRGHTDSVFGLSCMKKEDESTSQRFLASCSKDKTAKIWDLDKLTCVWSIENQHTDCVRDVEFVNNEWIATGSWDTTIGLFDIEKQVQLTKLKRHQDWVRDLYFDHERQMLYSGGADNIIYIWDVRNFTCVGNIDEKDGIYSMLSIPGHNMLLTGDEIGELQTWDIRKMPFLDEGDCITNITAHSDVIWNIKLTNDDGFVTCSSDKTVKTWKLGEDKAVDHMCCGFKVYGIAPFRTTLLRDVKKKEPKSRKKEPMTEKVEEGTPSMVSSDESLNQDDVTSNNVSNSSTTRSRNGSEKLKKKKSRAKLAAEEHVKRKKSRNKRWGREEMRKRQPMGRASSRDVRIVAYGDFWVVNTDGN